MMKITRTSKLTGITRSLEMSVTPDQMIRWETGVLIQEAMPQLSDEEREFIMTGITPEEWNKLFTDAEE